MRPWDGLFDSFLLVFGAFAFAVLSVVLSRFLLSGLSLFSVSFFSRGIWSEALWNPSFFGWDGMLLVIVSRFGSFLSGCTLL